MRALAIAATGMSAQQTNVEVIANNIANINTTAFKRARAEFSDLIYQSERAGGVPNRGGEDVVPEGAQLGLGVRTAGIRNLHIQGPLAQTGNPLDLALNGRGWFQITGPSGETVYTRAGSFNKNGTGQLVTGDGYVVNPAIQFAPDTTEIIINESGEVYARVASQVQPQLLGQINLVDFANDAGLQALGNNLYRETSASGQPISGVPGDPGVGTIHQSYLESSNVDPVKEITELITAQRAYEMNSKVIQAADEMQATVSKGIR
jgi:flagellar basal-body rod protein FlgG